MITDGIGRHEVLLPINHKNYNFRQKKNSQVMKERENWHLCRSEIDNSQNQFAGCQVTSEKQVKNATMHEKRTIAQNFAEFC